MSKEIILANNRGVAIVDDEDFGLVSAYKWYFSGNGYAHCPRVGKIIKMHRLILDPPVGMEVDHINGNGLDNRRENIRPCTCSQNQHNTGNRKNNMSGYKGGCFNKKSARWKAQIRIPGKRFYLGQFQTPLEAAIAYDEGVKKYHGEFARLNFE